MARKKSPTLTDGELRIMDVLWSAEEASVREVTDVLRRREPVAYNTVQTILGILRDKGYVEHRKEGRAFIYRPLVGRGEARSRALKHLVTRFFDNSPTALAQSLLEEGDVDLLELRRMRDTLRSRKKGKKKGQG
jgi:predicted transcriptional regulator